MKNEFSLLLHDKYNPNSVRVLDAIHEYRSALGSDWSKTMDVGHMDL